MQTLFPHTYHSQQSKGWFSIFFLLAFSKDYSRNLLLEWYLADNVPVTKDESSRVISPTLTTLNTFTRILTAHIIYHSGPKTSRKFKLTFRIICWYDVFALEPSESEQQKVTLLVLWGTFCCHWEEYWRIKEFWFGIKAPSIKTLKRNIPGDSA